MRTTAEVGFALTLVLQRLMDADLLVPEEGLAILAEIEAFDPAGEVSPGEERPEGIAPLLERLEALLHTGRLEASVAGQAKAIVRQILHTESDPI